MVLLVLYRTFTSDIGRITSYNVCYTKLLRLRVWVASQENLSIGAMGTRAKQRAIFEELSLDFTYGVIDKCILRALRGQDSLILTTRITSYNVCYTKLLRFPITTPLGRLLCSTESFQEEKES